MQLEPKCQILSFCPCFCKHKNVHFVHYFITESYLEKGYQITLQGKFLTLNSADEVYPSIVQIGKGRMIEKERS